MISLRVGPMLWMPGLRQVDPAVSPKSKKWTVPFLSYLIDTSRCNAQTVYHLNNDRPVRGRDSYEFGCQLAWELVEPSALASGSPFAGLTDAQMQAAFTVTGMERFNGSCLCNCS